MLQKYLKENIDLGSIPQVFLHGNPHLDNYSRTNTGAGMVDFDRSMIGPYVWDIIRFLGSMSLQHFESAKKENHDAAIIQSFSDGYLSAFKNPDLFYSIPHFIMAEQPKKEERSTKDYLEANIKWAKKMRSYPLSIHSKEVTQLLDLYLKARHEEQLLTTHSLDEAGFCAGSLGKKHFILSLAPKRAYRELDHILLDLKECYVHDEDKIFFNPVEHNGLRMVKASNLYSPGVEQRLAHFTYQSVAYWGRQIPHFKRKIKHVMSREQSVEFAFCVGQQLGRGHRRSCKKFSPQMVENHFKLNLKNIVSISNLLLKEVLVTYEALEKKRKLEQRFEMERFNWVSVG
jgi:hypothetical protein